MARRHPALPTLWLMTDERQGERLWAALARLPRGSGIVFRHHATVGTARVALRTRIARIARRRGLVLAEEDIRPRVIVRIVHLRTGVAGGIWVARAGTPRQAITARRLGAAAVLVSPVYATHTHPGRRALGLPRAAAIARAGRLPAIALGGMTARRFRQARGFHGWAAIDGLTPPAQKRNAVPI